MVPLDGSILSETVLPYARQLAVGLKARVLLLRVVEPSPQETQKHLTAESLAKSSAAARAEAEQYLQKVEQYLKGANCSTTTKVVQGVPAVEIIGEADGTPDSVIAMSTHGKSGLARWLIGSVADKVLHYAASPVLLIRPKPHSPIAEPALKAIVVPLDGSTVAEEVFPHVVALAKAMNLAVHLARITPSVTDYYKWTVPNSVPVDYTEIMKEVDADAEAYLAATAARLAKQGVKSVQSHSGHGDAASAIIDLVSETPDSFVAMTTRGRSGMARALLGSVADRVVRHCGEPVFLVRPA